MADRVTVWFDAEADYLEVQFKCWLALIERVDAEGDVIGFSILGSVASRKKNRWKLNSRLRNDFKMQTAISNQQSAGR